MKPFRFWCQKVLPLVFDDSLSYYEVLCKMGAKINEIIEYITNGLEEALKDFFPDAMYDAENERIRITVGEQEPVDNGEKVKSFQVGDKIITIDDSKTDISYDQTHERLIIDGEGTQTNAGKYITNIGFGDKYYNIRDNSAIELYGKKILIVVDDLLNVDSWSPLLRSVYKASSVDVVKMGAFSYAECNRTATNTINSSLDSYTDVYDYILLAMGQYDYIKQKEIGVYSDYGDSAVERTVACLGNVLSFCNTKFTKAQICIMTPISNRTAVASIGQYAGGGQYKAVSQACYNLAIKRIAKHYGAMSIDGGAAPFCAPWQTVLFNRYFDNTRPAPYTCVPNNDYSPYLAEFVAKGLHGINDNMPNDTDTMIFDYPDWSTDHEKVFRYAVNRHTTFLRIECAVSPTTQTYTDISTPTWDFPLPIGSAKFSCIAFKSGAAPISCDLEFVSGANRKWRVDTRHLEGSDPYTIYANIIYQNSIGSQGA